MHSIYWQKSVVISRNVPGQNIFKQVDFIVLIDINQNIMGSICQPKDASTLAKNQDEKQKEVIQVNDVSTLQSLKFQVSTEKLIHITADLLVIFMDHTTNIKRNDHFIKLPTQGAKLQEHAKAYLQKNRLSDSYGSGNTKFVTFGIIIPTLNFTKVSILFCDTWRDELKNQKILKELVREYFESIADEKFKNIAITEFTSQLGIHLQKGVKRIMREIVRMEHKPDVIQFCCLNEDSKHVFMEGVNLNHEQLTQSFSTMRSQESNYF